MLKHGGGGHLIESSPTLFSDHRDSITKQSMTALWLVGGCLFAFLYKVRLSTTRYFLKNYLILLTFYELPPAFLWQSLFPSYSNQPFA